jgi:hypothetical protein
MRFFAKSTTPLALAMLSGCASLLISGCASQYISTGDTSPMTGATIGGMVHGGQNPVTGATVQLWAVGSGSYGAAATALGSSVTTNASGNFTIGAYTCPTGTTQVYLTSKGGNPGLGTGTNSNIMLAAALGNCSTASSDTVNINEVTTVAAAYALGQYFTTTFGATSTDSFGAPSTTQAQTGILNAFATVNNLASFNTGTAVTSINLPTACTSASTFCIQATPESGKLNTIADILAACVNSAGGVAGDTSACGQLFAEVVTATGTAPTDTLQAAVYMSLNPVSTNNNSTFPTSCTVATSPALPTPNNLCALFSLISSTPPFVAGSEPTDWTLGIQYTDIVTTTPVLTAPQGIAVDASGNIWVASDGSSNTGGAMGELSPTGTPLVGTNFSSATNGPITALNPRNIAVDLTGDVWLTTSSGSGVLFEYVPGTTPTINSIKLGKDSYGIAIDGNNNVFVGEESSTDSTEATAPLGGNSVYEFLGANINQLVGYPVSSLASALRPEYMAFDASGNLWLNDGGDQATVVYQFTGITPCAPSMTSGTVTYCEVVPAAPQNVYNIISQGSPNAPDGVAQGSGGIWYANRAGNNLTFLSLTGTTVNSGVAYPTTTPTIALSAPKFVAVDGAGNVWTGANNETSPASISELSSTGTVLSPVNTGNTPFNVLGFSHAGLTTVAGVAIDPSGNVWAADGLATGTTSGASVFELVGAGAPTVTPIALAVKNATVAKKP